MSRDRSSRRSSTRGMSPQAKVRAYFRNHPKLLWLVYAVTVLTALGGVVALAD